MKKLICLIYFAMTSLLIFSQNYQKTVAEGKEWKIILHTGMGGEVWNYYHISCDTLIGDQVYYQVESENYEEARGLVREDTIAQKVYFWSNDSLAERLVLDYQLEQGDRFDFGGGVEHEVDTVYYTNGGTKIILFTFQSQFHFIEGVGHNFNGIINYIEGWQNATINDTLDICVLTAINEKIKIDNNINIFPNPTKGQLHITQEKVNELFRYTLIDINGVLRHRGEFYGDVELKFDHLENGLYYLKILNEDQFRFEKILIRN